MNLSGALHVTVEHSCADDCHCAHRREVVALTAAYEHAWAEVDRLRDELMARDTDRIRTAPVDTTDLREQQ